MNAVEIEVKFLVEDLAAMRHRILERGGCSRGRKFERNFRYDDRQGRLQAGRRLLRLREDPRVTLTYKAPGHRPDPDFKVHQEVEVGVDDRAAMEAILAHLGFQRVQCYEKWRESFRLGDVEVCLDELPMGNFLEIEGPREAIRITAGLLGLDWDHRILANYLAIFESLRQTFGLAFKDLTFHHFAGLQADLGPMLRAFRGGFEPEPPGR
jgi:adenylate cyclase class 2